MGLVPHINEHERDWSQINSRQRSPNWELPYEMNRGMEPVMSFAIGREEGAEWPMSEAKSRRDVRFSYV